MNIHESSSIPEDIDDIMDWMTLWTGCSEKTPENSNELSDESDDWMYLFVFLSSYHDCGTSQLNVIVTSCHDYKVSPDFFSVNATHIIFSGQTNNYIDT